MKLINSVLSAMVFFMLIIGFVKAQEIELSIIPRSIIGGVTIPYLSQQTKILLQFNVTNLSNKTLSGIAIWSAHSKSINWQEQSINKGSVNLMLVDRVLKFKQEQTS